MQGGSAGAPHRLAILMGMEPESVRTTESAVPEQRDDAVASRSAPSEVLIPTPRQVEPLPAGPETAGDPDPNTGPNTGSDQDEDHHRPGARQEPAPAPLSARERSVLDFEKVHWQYSGAKEQAIRERFGISATNYFQLLNALLDRQEALAAEPVLVNRLRRERDARRRSRSSHRGDGV